ncbi:Hypothetical protein CAP_7677 [Chondromyces apiculatus DSM 436]|uniref:Uncharacterized protein n=1 Tax=Chondromyces apiculatus DSM 436 TaxID=1192034 RepID=A0A017SY47_9BACT|nr:Hypothetical protein CAP_7677 [Chondromyces apiculatus DSM 436]
MDHPRAADIDLLCEEFRVAPVLREVTRHRERTRPNDAHDTRLPRADLGSGDP